MMPPKASPKKEKPKKGKKTKKTVPTVVAMPDSDKQIEHSQSLLDTGAVARLARSEVEDGDGGKARLVPSATVTSAAALSDEDDEEEGAPPPKKSHVSESMDTEKEQKLVDFFASHPIFYDQALKLSSSSRTGDTRITC